MFGASSCEVVGGPDIVSVYYYYSLCALGSVGCFIHSLISHDTESSMQLKQRRLKRFSQNS